MAYLVLETTWVDILHSLGLIVYIHTIHIVWKWLKMSHLDFGNFHQFLSASGFQKIRTKWIIFDIFNFYLKCRRSSLRSQCWMRLFLKFFVHFQTLCWFKDIQGGLPRYQDIKLALKFAHVPKRKLSFGLNLCACSISNCSEFKDWSVLSKIEYRA